MDEIFKSNRLKHLLEQKYWIGNNYSEEFVTSYLPIDFPTKIDDMWFHSDFADSNSKIVFVNNREDKQNVKFYFAYRSPAEKENLNTIINYVHTIKHIRLFEGKTE